MSGVPAESRHGGDGQLRSTGASLGWDRSKEEASRFARVMVSDLKLDTLEGEFVL